MIADLRLGPLRLEHRLGSGGMADVWAAEHVASGVAVAVKLIRREGGHSSFRAAALRNEIRTLARLDHHAIVPVLDQGEIPDDVAARSRGALIARTPYFVMARTNGGTLDDAAPPNSFEELRTVLARILSALAHAHARGVLHRDVKPSNVLMHVDASGQRSVLLSDFGIAHALRAPDGSDPLHAGTPQYMAPEQIAGRPRDEGPGTDLYALGCVTYRLAGGAPPFSGDVMNIRRAQLLSTPPRLAAPWPLPRAFLEWVLMLLAKRPSHRFASAAAALDALRSIRADEELVIVGAPRARRSRPSSTNALTVVPATGSEPHADLETDAMTVHTHEVEATRRPSTWPRPRILRSWRALPPPPASLRLLGAGLGLYGLRPVPLAAREQERDHLWDALVQVSDSSRPRVVVMRGPTGLGKTRLAEWLVELAQELGVALTLGATHGAGGGPEDGLGAMLMRHLRSRGLGHDELVRRVEDWLAELGGPRGSRADAEDVVAILEDRHERFARPSDRHAVIRRVLSRLARAAPVIVAIDDAPLGLDTIAFVESMLAAPEQRLPVLIVATARDEDLAQRPEEAARLAAIVRSDIGTELRVDPLDPDAHARLVEELLGLEREVARQVADRTSGSPLFAVQLVGDWVQRAILVPGPHGFRLQGGASARIPDDIHEVWSARVSSALAAFGGDEEEARCTLELAAAFGTRVDLAEWRLACVERSVPAPDSLLEVLAAAGLVRLGARAALFVHGMLRESVERGAQESKRFAAHHRTCASVVEARGGDPERVAHHRIEAGELDAALPSLVLATKRRLEIGDVAGTHRLLARYAETLDALRVPPADARRGTFGLLAAEAALLQGLLDDAEAAAAAIDPRALEGENVALRGWLAGTVRQKRGDSVGALASFAEARTLAEAGRHRATVARCTYGMAECEKLLGRFDASRASYELSGALFRDLGLRALEARVLTGLSDLEGRVGRVERALTIAYESHAILERLGVRVSTAIVVNGIGDLLRKLGRLDEAEASYREALDEFTALASTDATFVRLNLGLVQLTRGDLAGADETLAEVETELARSRRHAYVRMVRAIRLASAARVGAWDRFDIFAEDAGALLSEGGILDPDIAWALGRATDECLAKGMHARARRVGALAVAQWRRLGDDRSAERVEGMIAVHQGR
jgi:serine/threonine protein kinase/tetratricopeptide (TPR) repeat protein